MKKLIAISLTFCFALTGCDVESPMDKDLYPQYVYIVGAKDKILYRDLNIGYLEDTVNISIAVSGSRPSARDVTVTIVEDPDAIGEYNFRELSAEAPQNQKLPDDLYEYPQQNLTVPAGQEYNTYPVYIEPQKLHCDSLYMLALKLSATTNYNLNKEDTVVLVKFNLINEYSGLYYTDALIKNVDDPKKISVYKMARNLVATDNGKTVRMTHLKNEISKNTAVQKSDDTRITNAFRIIVNGDNSISLSSWDKFELIDGGGMYYPEFKVFEIWYLFEENGATWQTEGYIYKERKTADEQRIIDDWLEDQKKVKKRIN